MFAQPGRIEQGLGVALAATAGHYHAAVRVRIRRTWGALTDRAFPAGCRLAIRQSPGGVVMATSAEGCALAREDRLQLEAAALMAQPLPFAGYERVFQPGMHVQL